MGIKINGLDEVFERLDGLVDETNISQAIGLAVAFVEREAVMKAPKEIESGFSTLVDGLTGVVFNNHKKAPWIEYGTGLESIHPMGGRKDVPWVYVEGYENNPPSKRKYTEAEAKAMVASMKADGIAGATYTYGSKPQPFMRPALDENIDKIKELLREGIIDG